MSDKQTTAKDQWECCGVDSCQTTRECFYPGNCRSTLAASEPPRIYFKPTWAGRNRQERRTAKVRGERPL